MTEPVPVPVLRVDAHLPLPAYARADDAGLDLHAAEAVTLKPGDRMLVSTGIALAIPAGFAGFVLPRSGLALRHGVTVLNTPGLIDAGYRGEVKVLLVNHGHEAVTLSRGDRIAARRAARRAGRADAGGGSPGQRPGRRRLRQHRQLTPRKSDNPRHGAMTAYA